MLRNTKRLLSWQKCPGDEGWTFIEALLSVFLLTMVFLGFTITLISFREWMNRSWAIRVIDQYANDVMSKLDNLLQTGASISVNTPQYGLGSFSIVVNEYPTHYPALQVIPIKYTFSAHPTGGVFIGIGGAAPKEFYDYCSEGDEQFPPKSWNDEHEFTVTQFEYFPGDDIMRSESFNEALANIFLTIQYERPREVETPRGTVKRSYELQKQYRVSVFIKNYLIGPQEES